MWLIRSLAQRRPAALMVAGRLLFAMGWWDVRTRGAGCMGYRETWFASWLSGSESITLVELVGQPDSKPDSTVALMCTTGCRTGDAMTSSRTVRLTWVASVALMVLIALASYMLMRQPSANASPEPAASVVVAATPTPSPTRSPTPPPAPAPDLTEQPTEGAEFARMTIPRLGADVIDVPVLQGVGDEQLAVGMGHFPTSALPGQAGNFAFAGHRSTHSEPLRNVDLLQPGDFVYVRTAANWYTYRLYADRIVEPTALWVVDPVPLPGEGLSPHLITLVTCNPRWGSTERWIWWGQLAAISPVSAGDPPLVVSG